MSDKEILDIVQRLTAIETKLDAIIGWQKDAPCPEHTRFMDRVRVLLVAAGAIGGVLATLGVKVVERWMGGAK